MEIFFGISLYSVIGRSNKRARADRIVVHASTILKEFEEKPILRFLLFF